MSEEVKPVEEAPVEEAAEVVEETPAEVEEAAPVVEEGERTSALAPEPDADVDYAAVEMPEGITLDEAALTHFAPRLKEMNVSGEAAKELFADFSKYQTQQVEAQTAEFNKAWDADVAEIGEIPKEDLASAKIAMETFFDDKGKELLSGRLGDVPSVVNALVKIGKAMREDKFVEGGAGGSSSEPAEKILYPTMSE